MRPSWMTGGLVVMPLGASRKTWAAPHDRPPSVDRRTTIWRSPFRLKR
jgi:hypothetical protein